MVSANHASSNRPQMDIGKCSTSLHSNGLFCPEWCVYFSLAMGLVSYFGQNVLDPTCSLCLATSFNILQQCDQINKMTSSRLACMIAQLIKPGTGIADVRVRVPFRPIFPYCLSSVAKLRRSLHIKIKSSNDVGWLDQCGQRPQSCRCRTVKFSASVF